MLPRNHVPEFDGVTNCKCLKSVFVNEGRLREDLLQKRWIVNERFMKNLHIRIEPQPVLLPMEKMLWLAHTVSSWPG